MSLTRKVLAGFWMFGGIMHFVIPRTYQAIVPPQVPMSAADAVAISGVAEFACGVAVLNDRTLPAARWGILALLVAVFPANIYMAVDPEGAHAKHIPRILLWGRLPLQALLGWWAWKGTEPRETAES
jgi:uncharacterized membrane protein